MGCAAHARGERTAHTLCQIVALFTQDIGVETAGRWVGVGVACSLVAGEPEKCRCSCLVFCSRSRVRVYTCVSCGIRLGVPGWPLMPYLISAPLSRSGRLPPKLRASCAPADPGPRPAATPARPPPLPLAPWRLGLGSASCIAIGLSRRPPRAGLADVARPHCATASIGIMSGSNSQIEYPQGPIRDQFPASLTNTRARQPPEPQACAGSAFC